MVLLAFLQLIFWQREHCSIMILTNSKALPNIEKLYKSCILHEYLTSQTYLRLTDYKSDKIIGPNWPVNISEESAKFNWLTSFPGYSQGEQSNPIFSIVVVNNCLLENIYITINTNLTAKYIFSLVWIWYMNLYRERYICIVSEKI